MAILFSKLERWQDAEIWLVGAIGIATILSRLPFQINFPNSFDAINYMLALDHFDIRIGQPQAPGYPLYIMLGRIFNLLLQDRLNALVWVSTVFSGLGVIAIYLMAREMYGRRVALLAAVLLATSPSFWLQGEIAAPYTADLFASAMVGWLCYRSLNSPTPRLAYVAALAIGLAGALRPQTIVFLFPLFFYALHQQRWLVQAQAIGFAGGVFGAFFVPSVIVSGGWSTYMEAMRGLVPPAWFTERVAQISRVPMCVRNLYILLRDTITTLGEWNLVFVFLGGAIHSGLPTLWRNRKRVFLALWVLPAWVVCIVLWPGNPGTILVLIPPFYLLAARGLALVLERLGKSLISGALLAGLLLWQMVLFAGLPERPLGQLYRRFDNRQSLVMAVSYFQTKLFIVSQVPPSGTIVYASEFRHLQYFLPQYRTFTPPDLVSGDPNRVKRMNSIENGVLTYLNGAEVSTVIPLSTQRIVFFDLPRDMLLVDQKLIQDRRDGDYVIHVVEIPEGYRTGWTTKGLSIEGRR
jgi:uncharacterized membrane protein